jgi:hypothetical protein
MALSAEDLANHPRLIPCIRQQAFRLLSIQEINPRLAAVFAGQQRWLMSHMALAQYFRSEGPKASAGLRLTKFITAVASEGVASKNTADAFLKEMLKYGYVQYASGEGDRRTRPLAPAPLSIQTICGWLAAHLETLDALDGARRRDVFLGRPQLIAAIQPIIADGLLQNATIRAPAPAFSLFAWLNEGGVVMDWLIAGLADVAPGAARIPSSIASFEDLAARINLSRTHLTRKLRMAEAMGSLGWLGERGKSVMWVSADFQNEYIDQQCVKLAIIDGAFQAVAPSIDVAESRKISTQ